VNHVAKAVLILTIRDGAIELRRIFTAAVTLAVADDQLRPAQALAAKDALRSSDGRK